MLGREPKMASRVDDGALADHVSRGWLAVPRMASLGRSRVPTGTARAVSGVAVFGAYAGGGSRRHSSGFASMKAPSLDAAVAIAFTKAAVGSSCRRWPACNRTKIYGGFFVDSGCANLAAACGGSRVLIRAVRTDNGFALFDRGASRGQSGPTRGPIMV